MKKILVIGATGFVGRHLSRALLSQGMHVRCLARNPGKAEDLAQRGAEIVQGDFSDLPSMNRALESVDAAFVSVHTLSPQPASPAGEGFMEVEMAGLRNIVSACKANGVRRLVYITFLGSALESPSAWSRGRREVELYLLNSGLDVTVIRPGQIVGVGGHGFDMMLGQAKRSFAIVLGNGRQLMRNISLDDLIYYLVGVLEDARAIGQCYDVGCDDVLTSNQMIDVAADVLGRRHPVKVHLPPAMLSILAPVVERRAKLPKGSISSFVDGLGTDLNGDPMPIRNLMPRSPLSYRKSVEKALNVLPN